MLPDPLFWYGLVLKMAMTGDYRGGRIGCGRAQRAVHRCADRGAADGRRRDLHHLALEHPPAFIAASAVGSAAANAAVAIFALTYAALAQRQGNRAQHHGRNAGMVLPPSPDCALSTGHRRARSPSTRSCSPSPSRPRRATAAPRCRANRSSARATTSRLRAATAALVVAVVTTASHQIGSFASGVFAVFPIVMGSFVVILHPRVGGPAAGAVLAHRATRARRPWARLLGLHYLAEPFGVWWGFAGGLAIAMAWSAMLWLLRRARLRA